MGYFEIVGSAGRAVLDDDVSVDQLLDYLRHYYAEAHVFVMDHQGQDRGRYSGGRVLPPKTPDSRPKQDVLILEWRDGRVIQEYPDQIRFSSAELRVARWRERWQGLAFAAKFVGALLVAVLVMNVCNSCVPGMPPSLGGC